MLTIFLDIDGVLNMWGKNHKLSEINLEDFGPFCNFNADPLEQFVSFLKELEKIVEYEIVISSSWRNHFSLDEFVGMGKQLPEIAYIVSKFSKNGWRTDTVFRGIRGDEINLYLKDHNITNYICIDDMMDFYNTQNTHYTQGHLGFTEEDKISLLQRIAGNSNSNNNSSGNNNVQNKE